MTETRKIYLVCGSGGVGKTTLSAALGLKFAREGNKTIVLTIDPARRLATSLGLEGLTDTPKKIELPESEGEMWAMMLDTKRTFDRIVEKYAPSREVMDQIFNNMVYRNMSQMLAGTQEFMAMERLYEIQQSNEYEVIILDTPPMQNALDFLSAPQRMANLINNSFMQLLLKPAIFLGKSGYKILEKGTKQILKVFDKIAGFAFLQDLSDMFISFKELLVGFQDRAEDVKNMMSLPICNFVSVCTTNENSIAEALLFQDQLERYHYRLEKIIVNRIYKGEVHSKEKLVKFQHRMAPYCTRKEAVYLVENYRNYLPLIKNDEIILSELQRLIGKNNVTTVPLFLSDVHDMESLERVSMELTNI